MYKLIVTTVFGEITKSHVLEFEDAKSAVAYLDANEDDIFCYEIFKRESLTRNELVFRSECEELLNSILD